MSELDLGSDQSLFQEFIDDHWANDEANSINIEPKSSGLRALVIGIGARGGEVVDRIAKKEFPGIRTAVADTDIKNLLPLRAQHRILLTNHDDSDFVAWLHPRNKQIEILESLESLSDLANVDIVFVISGLRGFAGFHGAQIIATKMKKQNIPVISICHVPFAADASFATKGLKSVQQMSDLLVVVPNEKLPKIPPEALLAEGLAIADEPLAKVVADLVNPAKDRIEQEHEKFGAIIEKIHQSAFEHGFILHLAGTPDKSLKQRTTDAPYDIKTEVIVA
ncbi:MAG: hypothetical protein ACXACI_10280 [Candidatus Hodarchaeales archaeon]|jgi:cell division GTPase FtsZ